uniref:Uncharacterized protein n=1 Tax=Anguilla anguilla TaxID=7936 RepID=A0A0E9VM25_ANGAN
MNRLIIMRNLSITSTQKSAIPRPRDMCYCVEYFNARTGTEPD